MSIPVVIARVVHVVAAILTAACAQSVDREPEAQPVEPSRPSIGAAARRANASSWDVVFSVDFNGDYMMDVLWSQAGTNSAAVALMEGTRLLALGPLIQGPTGLSWIASAADFNGDGMADLAWTDPEQSLITLVYMEGSQLLSPGPRIFGPSGRGWIGWPVDFNADRMVDVLWSHPKRGEFSVWLMEGVRLLAPGPFIPWPPGEGWSIATLGDFNGDALMDLVWRNAKQNVMAVWLMDGSRPLVPGPYMPGPPGDGWDIIWGYDFNRDGMSDILWNNAEQNVISVWLMDGTRVLAPGPFIPGPAGDGWRARAAGDVNHDGMGDVIWQREGASEMAVWLMEGTHLLAPGPVILGPQ